MGHLWVGGLSHLKQYSMCFTSNRVATIKSRSPQHTYFIPFILIPYNKSNLIVFQIMLWLQMYISNVPAFFYLNTVVEKGTFILVMSMGLCLSERYLIPFHVSLDYDLMPWFSSRGHGSYARECLRNTLEATACGQNEPYICIDSLPSLHFQWGTIQNLDVAQIFGFLFYAHGEPVKFTFFKMCNYGPNTARLSVDLSGFFSSFTETFNVTFIASAKLKSLNYLDLLLE